MYIDAVVLHIVHVLKQCKKNKLTYTLLTHI